VGWKSDKEDNIKVFEIDNEKCYEMTKGHSELVGHHLKPVDYNAHHGQSAFIRSGKRNLLSVLPAHIEAVSVCRRKP
jgi:hypothetical protein